MNSMYGHGIRPGSSVKIQLFMSLGYWCSKNQKQYRLQIFKSDTCPNTQQVMINSEFEVFVVDYIGTESKT